MENDNTVRRGEIAICIILWRDLLLCVWLHFFCPLKYNQQKLCHIISKKQNNCVLYGMCSFHYLEEKGWFVILYFLK